MDFIQCYVSSVFGGQNHRYGSRSFMYYIKMAWYKNNTFYFHKIQGDQHLLPVMPEVTRHVMVDLLILRSEETIKSSTLTSNCGLLYLPQKY